MATGKLKSARKLQRHFKGVANHTRIEILLHIAKHPGMILEDIVEATKGNEKTIGEHTRRLVLAGLIEKKYAGRMVEHTLTPYGQIFVDFISEFAKHGIK